MALATSSTWLTCVGQSAGIASVPTGTIARRKPIRPASVSRRPIPATLRISPARPTSPNATTSDGRLRFAVAPATAREIASATAGSVLQPGDRPAHPGVVEPGGYPAGRLVAVDPADQRLHLGDERPAALERDGHAGPWHRLMLPGQEQPARVRQADQPEFTKLE